MESSYKIHAGMCAQTLHDDCTLCKLSDLKIVTEFFILFQVLKWEKEGKDSRRSCPKKNPKTPTQYQQVIRYNAETSGPCTSSVLLPPPLPHPLLAPN